MMDPDDITRGAVQTESGTNSNLRHAQREEQFRTDPGSEFQFKDKQRIFFFIGRLLRTTDQSQNNTIGLDHKRIRPVPIQGTGTIRSISPGRG
jgi:hypothetical protein